MINLLYHEKNDEDSLEAFRKLLGHRSDFNIHVSERLGSGTLQVITLDKGLYVRIWDCTFNHKIRLSRLADRAPTTEFLTLVYYLTPEAVTFENRNDKDIRVNKLWNTVFLSNNAEFNLDIHGGVPIKCFSICFTPEWIQSRVVSNGNIKEFIDKILKAPSSAFFFESYNALEEKMIHDIYASLDARHFGSLFIKSRVWTIINEFITKAAERRSLLAPVHVDVYEERIRLVESRLIQCLDTSLPSTKKLAREFALSESTLKRSFKRKYGMSVSNYYLDKKMIYARQLIHEKNKTVTETAYILGYEKVSHFIAMFKKHIGCLPGSLRRRVA